ncbi:MAG: lipocalin family protein [Phycisphaerae bacterium]
MKNVWKASVLSAGLLVLTGCGVAGKWTLVSITPEEARGHYALVNVTLDDDGTYAATAEKEGETVTSTGQYTFDNNKLTFTSADGKTRSYDAKLVWLGARMKVKTTTQDEEVTAIMKRE